MIGTIRPAQLARVRIEHVVAAPHEALIALHKLAAESADVAALITRGASHRVRDSL